VILEDTQLNLDSEILTHSWTLLPSTNKRNICRLSEALIWENLYQYLCWCNSTAFTRNRIRYAASFPAGDVPISGAIHHNSYKCQQWY